MAIISIFSASFCQVNEISKKLSTNFGYELISDKLIDETEKQYHVPAAKLENTLNGHISFINNLTHEKEKNIAYLTSVLARLIGNDNVIYHGFASHLLPNNISHILKVCLLADDDYRLQIARDLYKLPVREAKNKIRNDDERQIKWVYTLHQVSPWDQKLYDIMIPMQKSTLDQAVNLISENIKKPALQTTAKSRKALEDFLIVTRVNVPLVENGFDVNIKHNNGNITISLKEYVIRFKYIKKKIEEIVSVVQGVKNIEVIMGQDARIPSRYDELKSSPRFLLVDDEKEYVQTLSERLQTRDLNSTIVYDGEEALSQINREEPDVMVLDLKMPGVNGMDVLRKVKKERPHVEIIILTGHGSEQDKISAMELGAFAYLEKPVDIEVLAKTMKEAYNKINKRKHE